MGARVMHWPSLFETSGRVVETEWDELFERFSVEQDFRGDREQPGWSAAVFDPPRRGLENVRQVTAIVLDYDDGETVDGAEKLWGAYYGLIHTTRKHTPDAPRFRVILPLSRPVSAYEHEIIWRRVNVKAGGKLDPAPKDPSRFWYTPGTAAGYFQARRLSGALLDADEVLRSWPDANPQPAPVVPIRRPKREAGWSLEERARAWVAKADPAIQGSGGDAQTWAVARKLAADFELDEGTTFRILWNDYNPRCVPPWSEKELRHKAHDAVHKARVANPVDTRPTYAHDGDQYTRPTAATTSEPEDIERDAIQAEEPDDQPAQRTAVDLYGVKSMADLLTGVLERAQSGVVEKGTPSGNFELDEIIGGFRRKRVTILGAETSFGKSSFAIMAADEGMSAGHNILLVTAEDSDDTYGQRFMARRARVNSFRIRDNDCRTQDIDKMKIQVARAERAPFFIDAIGKPAEHMANAVTAIAREMDIALVIVDYLQAFTCAKRCQDRRTEVTHIARVFTDAIKGANASGLLLSQLKRPENANKPPSMHDLKESGDLENMAEHILLGQLEVTDDGRNRDETRWMIIGKNKDGPRNIDRVKMPFDPATASFKTVVGQSYRNYEAPHPADDIGFDGYDDG